MIFSDATNKTGIVEDIDFLCDSDDTAYPIAQKTRNINRWYHQIVSWILEAQDDWDFDDILASNYPIATKSLVANQQDYALPATAGVGNDRVLKLQRVEVTYDGVNWYKAEPINLKEIGTATDATTINNNFSSSEPFYAVKNNAIWLFPIPTAAVSGGLKVWFNRRITDIFTAADTTQEPSFDEQFHRILSYGPSYDFLIGSNPTKAVAYRQEITRLQQELKQFYGRKSEDRVGRINFNLPNYK